MQLSVGVATLNLPLLSALPMALVPPGTQPNLQVDSLLVGLDIRSQEINQVDLVWHIGEGCNISHQKGLHPTTYKHPQGGDTDGTGLKWVGKGRSMGNKRE